MDHHVQRSHSENMSHLLIDQTLTKQALAGDQGSFEVLTKKYEQPLRSYMRRILKDQELIADILQAVFFQLYVSLPDLRANLPLKPWLYRVAHNRCLDELRKNARRRTVAFSLLQEEDSEEEYTPVDMLPDTRPTPEEIFEQQELHDQLVHAMETLSPACCAVVHLRSFGELSFFEIGKQLNMPTNTAKVCFYRSLPRLRAALERQKGSSHEQAPFNRRQKGTDMGREMGPVGY